MAGERHGLERLGRLRDPLVGAVINGRFHVERPIARGGMGRVYYGTQAPLARPVALKIVVADSVNEDASQFLKRFLLEASILAKLQHPNVVTFFDYGHIEDASIEMYFIAMEYLDGESLLQRLRARGALEVSEALVLFRQIARGLREVHARGIVHRDLKPSNIVIARESETESAKLVDFGVGKIERSGQDLTRNGVLIGTPKYMAPEQFDGVCSAASDVYALGLVVYEMMTGGLPFKGTTLSEFVAAKLRHPLRTMREVHAGCEVPERVENLVYRMIARRPEARPSVDDILHELGRCELELFGSSAFALATSGARARLATSGARDPTPSSPHTHLTTVDAIDDGDLIECVPSNVASSRGRTEEPARSPAPRRSVPPPLPSRPARLLAIDGNALPNTDAPHVRRDDEALKGPTISISRVSLAFTALLALASTGILGAWLVRTRTSSRVPTSFSASPSPGASSSSSAASSSSASAPSTPEPRAATFFTLHVESVPNAAALIEDGQLVGVTPVDLRVERSSVTSHTRTFHLRKDGYAAAAFAIGVSEADIERTIALAPLRTASPPQVANNAKGLQPASKQVDLDIRLRR